MRIAHDIGGKKVTFVNGKLLLKKGEYDQHTTKNLNDLQRESWLDALEVYEEERKEHGYCHESEASKRLQLESYKKSVIDNARVSQLMSKGKTHCEATTIVHDL